MNLVLADAAFWIARRSPQDDDHLAAIRLAERLLRERKRLVVTPMIFAEVYARFSRGQKLRERVIRDIWENPAVAIEQPTFSDHTEAIAILRAHTDKTYSFCDAVSFAVMLRMEIRAAVTFDEHFRQFGQFDVIDGKSL